MKIGPYWFDANAVFVSRSYRTLASGDNVPYGEAHSWTVSGDLLGSGQADLIAKDAALRRALGTPYQDVVFYADNDAIAFALRNAGSTDGVRVTSLQLPGDVPGLFATRVAFSFTVEASYGYDPATLPVLEFSETLTVAGGGPRYEFTECVNALPVKSLITPHSVCRVVQRGSSKAVGWYRVPPPLFPGDLMEEPEIEYVSAKRSGQGYWEYAASWTYIFGGATRIDGSPTLTV